LVATEGIEGGPMPALESSLVTCLVQKFFADLRILDHGQGIEITPGGLATDFGITPQISYFLGQGEPAEETLALARAPAENAEHVRPIDDDFDAQHLG